MNKHPATTGSAGGTGNRDHGATFLHAPSPVAQVEGLSHVVLSINPVFCRLLERPATDLIGRPFAELVPEDGSCSAVLDRVARTGQAEEHVEAEGDDRRPVYWSYACWPITAANAVPGDLLIQVTETDAFHQRARAINQALLISSVNLQELGEVSGRLNQKLEHEIAQRDRTEAILQESERQLRTLADSIPHLVWMARPDGHMLWFNQRWYDYTGTTYEQVKGWNWQALLDPAELPRVHAKITAAFAQGEAWEDIFPLRRHDGEMRWHLGRMQPVHDEQGRVVRWFGTNTDVTEERLMEQELRRHGVVLAEADRHKSEFLATLAHELRNPLAPLRNGLDLLSLTAGDEALTERTHGMMQRQLDQMVRLIDQLMDLSRVTRGVIDLQTGLTDLRTVLEQAVETSRPLMEQQGHTLMLDMPDEPLNVHGDAMRLAQVFCNLLNNATKYTDPRGAITLRAERGMREASVIVEDNGIGIAQDQLGRVFNMFTQVEGGNHRVQGGLGIGLSLAKHLVEMHGGRIEVRSAGLGEGSSFTVSLPLAGPDVTAQPGPAAPPTAVTADPLRILIVDDNSDASSIMALLLTRLGHAVEVASNGEEALQRGACLLPHLVLMDIGMPVMNGHLACRLMKRTEWGRVAYIVALTGWGQDEDRRKSAEAGFDHHLVKPVGKRALQEVLASANGFASRVTRGEG